jgi:hypothetical protein
MWPRPAVRPRASGRYPWRHAAQLEASSFGPEVERFVLIGDVDGDGRWGPSAASLSTAHTIRGYDAPADIGVTVDGEVRDLTRRL